MKKHLTPILASIISPKFRQRIFIPLLLLGFTFAHSPASAQYFIEYGGNIPNNSTGNCFTVSVSGVGTLSAANALAKVCFSIDQARPSDMDITLQSPLGTSVVLSSDNGGSSGNDYYNGLCLTDCGPNGPVSSNSDWTGIYSPEGFLSDFYGENADGTWQICIDDDNATGGDGTLNYFSLSFGSTNTPALPLGENCLTPNVITALPYENTCMSLAATSDDYSACTSTMDGADYVFTYTPATNEHISILLAQDYWAPSGFPTVTLLDICPNLAAPANCLVVDQQFVSTEHIMHITSQPLTAGTTYYIVVSSTSGTGGAYDIKVMGGENGNDDCLNATVIDHNGFYAGNNYTATIPNLQAPNTTEMGCNGSVDNFVYYRFTTDAVGSTVYINLTEIECDIGCGGACGIQIALFQQPAGGPCLGPGTWGSAVFCEASTVTNQYYRWTGLAPLTNYYLVVDGNAGSQCVWNMQALGDIQLALPVTLTEFAGEPSGPVNNLHWQTSWEENANFFSVERKDADGEFQSIGQVSARGNSNELRGYDFVDASPLKGTNFYRLRQVDFDGAITFSETIAIETGQATGSVSVYPQPASDVLNVDLGGGENAMLEVMDINGNVVLSQQSDGAATVALHIEGLSPGLYFLRSRAGYAPASITKFIKR